MHCNSHSTIFTESRGAYFASCHPGLEEVLFTELKNIGAQDIHIGKAGVHFSGDQRIMFDSNLWLRTAIRVLKLVHQVELDPQIEAGKSIYNAVKDAIYWPSLLVSDKMSFSIESRIWGNSNFSNSQLLNVRAKDAICDSLRDQRGSKPEPPKPGQVANVPIFATCFQDQLSIYLDCSGSSLHKRGFKSKKIHKASLNEAAAAGCLYLSGWPEMVQRATDRDLAVLCDPMCGSGTFLTEAALMAGKIAPGLYRNFWPFLSWPSSIIDKNLWKERVQAARDQRLREKPRIELWGNDEHEGALSLAMENVKAAGVQSVVRLHRGDCSRWTLPRTPDIIVTNPPWGKRLEDGVIKAGPSSSRRNDFFETESTSVSWSKLGNFLKREAQGSDAYVLSGSAVLTKDLKLRAEEKYPLVIGGIDTRFLHYRIHESKIT
jgi:23S rRNA G2445 N2-methylase RlmL